jgi:IS5 family transposase
MTHQPSFAHAEFAAKKKVTRSEKFLARMEEVIPWTQLLAVIEPFYPQGKRDRPPIGLEGMLRVYLSKIENLALFSASLIEINGRGGEI